MTERAKVWLILPDIHFPHHDAEALECAAAICAKVRPDVIVQTGDALDCGAFSQHGRRSLDDVGGDFLADEIAPYNDFIDRLQGRSERRYVAMGGNHEDRILRWLANAGGAPAHSIAPLLDVEALLRHRVSASGRPRRERRNFEWVPYVSRGFYSHFALAPNLIAIHGWSVASNAAKAHMDKIRTCSVVHGHTHRAQSYSVRNPLTNESYTAWSPGCLSEFVPLYMASSPGDWTHGVSLVFQSRTNPRDWTHYVIPIERGRAILPDGREVAAA